MLKEAGGGDLRHAGWVDGKEVGSMWLEDDPASYWVSAPFEKGLC